MTIPAGRDAVGTLVVPTWRARGVALLWDYLVIVAWIGLLTIAGVIVRLLIPIDVPTGPMTAGRLLAADLTAFALTVLPVGIYLVVTEAGRHHASWGKRRAGLRVVRTDGSRPGFGQIVVRNAVKLAPWQLAHISVTRILLGVYDELVLTWTTYAASLVLVVVTVIVAWRDPLRRGLHDLIAGTRVVATA